jgi:iron complex outermembrane receptor protein
MTSLFRGVFAYRVSVLSALALSLQTGVVAAQESASEGLAEVVVTATKTGETNLQSTPLPITAFTAEDLAAHSIRDIQGIALNTPGLQLSDLSG